MGKYVVGGVLVVALLLGLGYYFSTKGQKPAGGDTSQNTQPPQAQMSTYATSTYSIKYPTGYTVDEKYAYQGVPKKPIAGVKFTIPGTMATGTNLSADSGVSVESLPRAKNCTGDIYIYNKVKASDLTVGSTTYSMASTSDAGAGNFHEEQVFAVSGSKPCTAVRYMIHSTNFANYPAGAVHEFDRAALLSDFDKIRNSLQLVAATP